MANDDDPVNSSGKPVNGRTTNDKLRRIEAQRDESLGQSTRRQDSLADQQKAIEEKYTDLSSKYNSTVNAADRTKLYDQILASQERYGQVEENMQKAFQEQYFQVNATAAGQIGTFTKYDNMNKTTTTMSGRQRYLTQIQQDRRAGGELLQTPTDVIESRVRSNQKTIASTGWALAGDTRALGDRSPDKHMIDQQTKIEGLMEDVALDKRLLKIQRKEGMTTEKRQYGARDTLDRAGGLLEQKALTANVSGGNYNLGDETSKLTDLFSNLSAAVEKFEAASENATDAQGNLTKEYRDASKNLSSLQKQTDSQRKLVTEIGKQGGGGGGKLGYFGGIAAQIGSVGVGIRDQTINLPTARRNLRAQFLNMGNEQYFSANSAIYDGNIDAMESVLSQSNYVKGKISYAKGIDKGTRVLSTTGEIGGHVVDGIASGQLVTGVKNAINAGTKTLTGMNTAVDTTLPVYESLKGVLGAERKIRVHQMQSFYSHGMGLYNSVTGMGNTNAVGARSMLADAGNLESLAGTGVHADNVGNLASTFAGQAGSFSSKGMLWAMGKAGLAKQRGQMSQEDYMGAAGSLVGAGGGSGDLENIIAAATAKGMDNSKQIGEMVSSTIQLSQGLASKGVAGTGTVQNLLALGTQSLVDSGVNKNLAIGAAASTLNNYNDVVTHQSMSFGNIIQRQQSLKMFPGTNAAQRDRITSLSLEEQAMLLHASKTESGMTPGAKQLLEFNGLTGQLAPNGRLDPAQARGMLRAGLTKTLVDSGAVGQRNVDVSETIDALESGRRVNGATQAVFANIGTDSRVLSRMVRGGNPDSKDATSKVEGWFGQMTPAKRKATEIGAGAGYAGSFEGIEQIMSEINKRIDPKDFVKAVAEGATDFTAVSADFTSATGKAAVAIKHLTDVINSGLRKSGNAIWDKQSLQQATNPMYAWPPPGDQKTGGRGN